MFTINQKRFSFLKKAFISFFTNGANRPGVNRPVRKMVFERIVPGGTGFGANHPVTIIDMSSVRFSYSVEVTYIFINAPSTGFDKYN